ncbi:LOW QUALITY PROTEIN: hypothetical protein PHMEG_00030471 [Phytophthora megakarya]|uniref:Retrotransposon gag domain-containing protein n=1 Tax=Phytophthora megakarya TaxID=4795 RepID=A0A225V082_9STRA|nr:LOW QUALITY PROTEIN: hypothetical protein PHMEG_00030471 [Phytophthora megakarya]
MGCEPQRFPSDAALNDWAPADAGTALRKWKKKLRAAFGVEEIAPGRQVVAHQAFMPADPSQVPLPQTPVKQNESSTGVFGSKGSPYMNDSHIVTPRSASRHDRVMKENEASRPIPTTYKGPAQQPDRRYDLNEDSCDDGKDLLDVDNLEGDLTEECARQIRELSAKEEKNSTPRIEITTHLPLGNIKAFSGYRNKSETSMQWLRTFIYEMKGTHTPPNDWCMAFELSLQDGALHWYRQLPHKTRRTWKLLRDAFIKYYCSEFNQSAKARYYSAKREDKEHVCDYLNRLNGYARNAGVQFENGGREAKDHMEPFLDTCDDRGLEERLCHVRVKDIHDLEDMINDILKRRDRKNATPRRGALVDGGCRRDGGRNEDSRSNYRRDDRRRDESPYRPRITLAEALYDLVTALNETSVGSQTSQQASYDQEYESNEDSFGDGARRDDEDRYSNRGSEYDYAGEDERGHVAAANDHEPRAAAEGTFARSGNRRSKGDGHFNNGRGFARHKRNGRQQYGPCAACGGLTHSVHYCYKRCKMCKQVHDAGKCEAFNELASLLRSKVDKNDLHQCCKLNPRYLFAFAGEVKWPEDRQTGFVNTTEIVEGNDGSLGENEAGELDAGEYDGFGFELGTERDTTLKPRSNREVATGRETGVVVISTIRQTEKDESRSHGCH